MRENSGRFIIRFKRGIARLKNGSDRTHFSDLKKDPFVERAPEKEVDWTYKRVVTFKITNDPKYHQRHLKTFQKVDRR